MRLDELLAQAPRIREIAAVHGASNLAAFGSVARDQAGPDSDLDLLIDLPPKTGLLERIALKLALEDMLHCRVDLLRRRNLRPTVLATAERDAIPL
jgi:predicted nucleotidyltransferase